MFFNVDYLEKGNPKQREVHRILKKYQILDILSQYQPIVIGTIPIGIDIDGSDVDICCCVDHSAQKQFLDTIVTNFSQLPEYSITTRDHEHAHRSIIVNFLADGIPVEIFAQNISSPMQNGYRHMLIEHKLLERFGEPLREGIISLKRRGIKTEPAFAELLGLKGDPYISLLEIDPSDADLTIRSK